MSEKAGRWHTSAFRELLLWFGMAGGPVAWALHLSIGYFIVSLPCMSDVREVKVPFYFATAPLAAIAAAAVIIAAANCRRVKLHATDSAESGGRPGFMAAMGMMLSGISLLAIGVQLMALPFWSTCE